MGRKARIARLVIEESTSQQDYDALREKGRESRTEERRMELGMKEQAAAAAAIYSHFG